MKTNFVVQLNGNDTLVADIEKLVKEELKTQGAKMNAIKTLDLYFKPNEKECYYIATTKDGELKGKVSC